MNHRILVVEDHEYLRKYIIKILQKENYQIFEASCGKKALQLLKTEIVDLILLDLGLGDMDGTEIIRLLRRQQNEIPIIVVSNFEQIDSKVNAFDLGCDDYITKPFYKEELLARIRRLNRRGNKEADPGKKTLDECVESGPYKIDYRSCTIYKNQNSLTLTRKLFDILAYMIENQNQVLTKEQLLFRFWKEKDFPTENTLSVHIYMLREQIESNPRVPHELVTMRGKGYMLKIKG